MKPDGSQAARPTKRPWVFGAVSSSAAFFVSTLHIADYVSYRDVLVAVDDEA